MGHLFLYYEDRPVEDFCLGPEASSPAPTRTGPSWLLKWMASSFRTEEPFTLVLGKMDNPNARCCPQGGHPFIMLPSMPNSKPAPPYQSVMLRTQQATKQAAQDPILPLLGKAKIGLEKGSESYFTEAS